MAKPVLPLHDAIGRHARRDFAAFPRDWTVGRALATIREKGLGEKIFYFYVLDDRARLVGVLPTRRLLVANLDTSLGDVMIPNVVAVPATASVLETCEFFVMHKFFALPIVDDERRLVGVVDMSLLTEEVFDVAEREQADAAFEALGFQIALVRDASPWKAYRYRFPWLLATIASGSLCALLTSVFEVTLAQSLILAFFLTLVLGLGESVTIQSMTLAIQALRTGRPTIRWYLQSLLREAGTALMLGGSCGLIVALIILAWRGPSPSSVVIGLGIFLSLVAACTIGLSVPTVLHALRLDPKIAAGPITLAITDVMTLLFYFGLAAMMLG